MRSDNAQQWRAGLFWLVCAFCGWSFQLHAEEDAGGQESKSPKLANTKPPRATVSMLPMVEFSKDGFFSEAASVECNLGQEVSKAVVKYAERYQTLVRTVGDSNELAASPNRLSLRFEEIRAGRAASGFGERWMASDLGVTATFVDASGGKASKYHVCTTGLGINPLANLHACKRLSKCADQLGKQIAAWLRTEVDWWAAMAAARQSALPDTALSRE